MGGGSTNSRSRSLDVVVSRATSISLSGPLTNLFCLLRTKYQIIIIDLGYMLSPEGWYLTYARYHLQVACQSGCQLLNSVLCHKTSGPCSHESTFILAVKSSPCFGAVSFRLLC